jgi:hypothetical protein
MTNEGSAADRHAEETPLIAAARRWVLDRYTYNSAHLVNTLEWLDRLAPGATEALRLAALTHDMERAFPGPDQPSMTSLTDPVYNRLHAARSARIVGAWLRAEGAADPLASAVERLVEVHEVGGWAEANLLQAADSISFLDANVELALNFVRSGRFPASEVRAKFDYSFDRIQVDEARVLARPYLERARARLAELAAGAAARDAAGTP